MGLHCKYMINVSDSASGFPSVGCTRSLLLCQEMGATQDKQLPYPIGRVGIDPVEVHKLPHHPWQTHLLPETRQKMGMYWQWKVWLLQCWGCNGEAKGACLHNCRPTKCCSGEAANGEANRCMFTTEGPPNGCCTDEGVNSTVVNGVLCNRRWTMDYYHASQRVFLANVDRSMSQVSVISLPTPKKKPLSQVQ